MPQRMPRKRRGRPRRTKRGKKARVGKRARSRGKSKGRRRRRRRSIAAGKPAYDSRFTNCGPQHFSTPSVNEILQKRRKRQYDNALLNEDGVLRSEKVQSVLQFCKDNLARRLEDLFQCPKQGKIIATIATHDYFTFINQEDDLVHSPEIATVEDFVADVTLELLEMMNLVASRMDKCDNELRLYSAWNEIENITKCFRQSSMDDKTQREVRKTREMISRSRVSQATFLRMKTEMEYRWVKFLAQEYCAAEFWQGANQLYFLTAGELDLIESSSLTFIKSFLLTEEMMAPLKEIEAARKKRNYALAHKLVTNQFINCIKKLLDVDGSEGSSELPYIFPAIDGSLESLILRSDPTPLRPTASQRKCLLAFSSRQPDLAALCFIRGKLYIDKKHHAEALSWYRLGLLCLENYHQTDMHISQPIGKTTIADTYLKISHHETPVDLYKEAIANFKEVAESCGMKIEGLRTDEQTMSSTVIATYARAHFGLARCMLRSNKIDFTSVRKYDILVRKSINLYKLVLSKQDSKDRQIYPDFLLVFHRASVALLSQKRYSDAAKMIFDSCVVLNQIFGLRRADKNLFEIASDPRGFEKHMSSPFWNNEAIHAYRKTRDLGHVLRGYFIKKDDRRAIACLDHYFSDFRHEKPKMKKLLAEQEIRRFR